MPGYLNNNRIAQRLGDLTLTQGAGAVRDNLVRCYEELVAAARWAVTHDPSAPFRSELTAALAALGMGDADVHF